MQSIEDKVLSRIYGKGRGWAFFQKDFSDIGSRSSLDIALYRLVDKGTVRRAMRGHESCKTFGLHGVTPHWGNICIQDIINSHRVHVILIVNQRTIRLMATSNFTFL